MVVNVPDDIEDVLAEAARRLGVTPERLRQSKGLTLDEQEVLVRLLHEYDRYMLVRARAAQLLHGRGHDVPSLITPL